MVTGEMKSACAIRSMYGLPCDRCKYNQKCSAYKKQTKEKEGKQNEQKKQRKRRSKDSDIRSEGTKS